MIAVREVENRVADQHHQLLVRAAEFSGQRKIADFNYFQLSDPLPELGLSRPKLVSVLTEN